MKSAAGISKRAVTNIEKTLWLLAQNAFWLIMLFIFIEIILGGFVFYNYVFLAENQPPQTNESVIKFNDKVFQNVLKELQDKEGSAVQLPSSVQ